MSTVSTVSAGPLDPSAMIELSELRERCHLQRQELNEVWKLMKSSLEVAEEVYKAQLQASQEELAKSMKMSAFFQDRLNTYEITLARKETELEDSRKFSKALETRLISKEEGLAIFQKKLMAASPAAPAALPAPADRAAPAPSVPPVVPSLMKVVPSLKVVRVDFFSKPVSIEKVCLLLKNFLNFEDCCSFSQVSTVCRPFRGDTSLSKCHKIDNEVIIRATNSFIAFIEKSAERVVNFYETNDRIFRVGDKRGSESYYGTMLEDLVNFNKVQRCGRGGEEYWLLRVLLFLPNWWSDSSASLEEPTGIVSDRKGTERVGKILSHLTSNDNSRFRNEKKLIFSKIIENRRAVLKPSS